MKEFVTAYLEAIEFTDCHCDNPELADAEFSPAMLATCVADCKRFCHEHENLLDGLSMSQCGHDFWLTRQGHGAGFCDRGLGKRGDLLTKAAHRFGEITLDLSDIDGMIYMR